MINSSNNNNQIKEINDHQLSPSHLPSSPSSQSTTTNLNLKREQNLFKQKKQEIETQKVEILNQMNHLSLKDDILQNSFYQQLNQILEKKEENLRNGSNQLSLFNSSSSSQNKKENMMVDEMVDGRRRKGRNDDHEKGRIGKGGSYVIVGEREVYQHNLDSKLSILSNHLLPSSSHKNHQPPSSHKNQIKMRDDISSSSSVLRSSFKSNNNSSSQSQSTTSSLSHHHLPSSHLEKQQNNEKKMVDDDDTLSTISLVSSLI